MNNLKVTLFAKHVDGNVTVVVADSFEKVGFTMLAIADQFKAGNLTVVHGAYSFTNELGNTTHVDISRDLRGSGKVQDLLATAV